MIYLFIFLQTLCFATHYPLKYEPIDVVIPCHPKDKKILKRALQGVRENVKPLGNIYIISPYKFIDENWINEDHFPFTHLFKGKDPEIYRRVSPGYIDSSPGWLLQQLIKLHVFEVLPGLSSNVLLLDADTIILQPLSLINQRGEPMFPVGSQYHEPYFHYGKKLLPGFRKVFSNHSGVVNMMLVQRPVMEDLLKTIREHHECEPWEAMIRCYLPNYQPDWIETKRSVVKMSEYELYFNFIFDRTKQAHISQIEWDDKDKWDAASLKKYRKVGYKFISAHHWLRK